MTARTMNEPTWLTRGQQLVKQPNESCPVAFDWSADLGRAEIRSSTWTVQNANPNLVTCAMRIEASSFDRHRTQATLIGGATLHLYVVTNTVVLTSGARIDRAIVVVCPS